MPVSFRKLFLIAPAFLAGCLGVTPPSEDPVLLKLEDLDRRLGAIERMVQNQSLVDLSQQVTALERQAADLQGVTESLDHNASTTAERQRELYNDLDARIVALEGTLTAASAANVLDGGALSPGQLPVPNGSADDNYRAGFGLIQEQRYQDAEIAFTAYLTAFPESRNAANAQYWLAESFYVRQQFDEALAHFQRVLDDYPGHRKAVDALLKVGYCNYELERWADAKSALDRVQSDYPETTAARLAGQRLRRMESEGV